MSFTRDENTYRTGAEANNGYVIPLRPQIKQLGIPTVVGQAIKFVLWLS
jgi:hypothetical protein